MPTKATRYKPYGYGRVQFFAALNEIRADLARGMTLQAAYNRRAKKLGVTYSSFTKLVARYANDARPAGVQPNKSITQETASHERSDRKQELKNPRDPRNHIGIVDPALIRRLVKGT